MPKNNEPLPVIISPIIEIDEPSIKSRMLAEFARLFIGVKEEGTNQGVFVERFQKAVDGKAQGEPWCMAFAWYLIKEVDRIYESILGAPGTPSPLFMSEHCQTVLNKSKDMIIQKPEIGCLRIWGHFKNGANTGAGHVGIPVKIMDEFLTNDVEGNTGPGAGVEREGDGVFEKTRDSRYNYGNMRHLGFLRVW